MNFSIKLSHIDSFCTNTAQGGWETLAAMECTLDKAKQLCPTMDNISLSSDGGSGFKSTQLLLGLRKRKYVDLVHFNASGEGKRVRTDGHFTAVKYQRKMQ